MNTRKVVSHRSAQRRGLPILVAIIVFGTACAKDAEVAKITLPPPARAVAQASASGPTYTTIDAPGDTGLTLATDINKSGQIVGRYTDVATGNVHGFLLSGGTFTTITAPPAALWTRAISINNGGDIVGDYSLIDQQGNKGVHGFLLHSGTFTSFDVPGSAGTVAEGIDTNGDIVGFYTLNDGSNTGTGSNNRHGFLLRNGVFTSIDFPGAGSTETWKINDNGMILGRFKGTTDSKWHLYELVGGSFKAVADYPGATQIAPDGYAHVGGLNVQGDIVATYCLSTCNKFNAGVHGFLVSGGIYTTVEPPTAVGSLAFGINSNGYIVGTYADAAGVVHGFLRIP